jgi:arylsulfatase A
LLASAASAAPRPNIVLIMADDLGYETLGANGGESYKTPNLDRLAATGMRFEHCYAQPLCTPTRVQLMTGQYNVRNYVGFGRMATNSVTFANLLKQAGYATGIAGKWQLGAAKDLPGRFGFDETCLWQHTRRPPRYANPGLEIDGVEKNFRDGEYGPDIVNRYALDFIARHKDGPFFLYYPMMLTHDPYPPTPDSADWNPKATAEKQGDAIGHFADMVAYMDKLVGKVAGKLDELELRDNTLLVFLGDNGTGRRVRSVLAGGEVRGGKGSTTRAGMRVPLIVNWPGKVAAGRVSGSLVDTTDFLPTLCAAAGAAVPPELPVDGMNLLPHLLGQTQEGPRRWCYSWYSPRGEPPKVFAFTQTHKLYRDGAFFELASDLGETHPLREAELQDASRESAAELRAALNRFKGLRQAEAK